LRTIGEVTPKRKDLQMSEIEMRPMEGTNPLGVLAALGAFRSAALEWPNVKLRWNCDEIVPLPVLSFEETVSPHELVAAIDAQRDRWRDSALLNNSYSDVKEVDLAVWARVIASDRSGVPVDELFVALVSQGAKDRNGNNKPTHLHFTAGQQQFLDIAREVLEAADVGRLLEAIVGPWRFDSSTKSLRWDCRGERIYAVRGLNPSKDPALTVPGAEWLAFLGLSFYPTTNRRGTLETTACDRDWKESAWRWALWGTPLLLAEVRHLLGSSLVEEDERDRRLSGALVGRNVYAVLQAPIRRSDQGGYGSFGAASIIRQ
jgi:hypothetical protein